MSLSRCVTKINGNFGRKSQIFPTPCVFKAPAEGVPAWNLVPVLGVQEATMMRIIGQERSLTIPSAVWMQYMKVTDEQMDGQTPADSKNCAYA